MLFKIGMDEDNSYIIDAKSKQDALDKHYDKNGMEANFVTEYTPEMKAQDLKYNKGVTEENLRNKMGGIGNAALTAYKFIAPDAAKETLEGKEPGIGLAKSMGKTALTAASMVAPVAAVPNIVGRIGLSGGLGLADYLGSKAIDTEMPTLPGAALATGLGALGQGVSEGVGKIGAKLVGKSFNVDEDVAKKLLNEDVIGIGSSKKDVIENINNKIKTIKENKDELLKAAEEGTFDFQNAKRISLDEINNAANSGVISFKQGDEFAKKVTAEFDEIIASGLSSPAYAYNRTQAMARSIPKGAESLQDINTAVGLRNYLGSIGLLSELEKVPGLDPLTKNIEEYSSILKNVKKAPINEIDITKPGTFIPSALTYQTSKIIPGASRGLSPKLQDYLGNK